MTTRVNQDAEAARAELNIALESRRIDVGEVTLHVVLAGRKLQRLHDRARGRIP